MIVRIMGEGQYNLSDESVGLLNEIDDLLDADLAVGSEVEFAAHLASMADLVRSRGTPVSEDALVTSDAVIPPPDISLEELRVILGSDGLIPGAGPGKRAIVDG